MLAAAAAPLTQTEPAFLKGEATAASLAMRRSRSRKPVLVIRPFSSYFVLAVAVAGVFVVVRGSGFS
jgi:hypothetical protein